MEWLVITMGILLGIVGIAGSLLPALPGPPIAYAGLWLQQLRDPNPFTLKYLLFWGALPLVIMILDYYVPTWPAGWASRSSRSSSRAPKGHYAGKDVELHPDQLELLDAFFEKMNTDAAYADYPIVNYHGYVQHRYGCLLSGDRSIYVDTDGDMLACPFCRTKGGSARHGDFNASIERIRASACPLFGPAELEYARPVPMARENA